MEVVKDMDIRVCLVLSDVLRVEPSGWKFCGLDMRHASGVWGVEFSAWSFFWAGGTTIISGFRTRIIPSGLPRWHALIGKLRMTVEYGRMDPC